MVQWWHFISIMSIVIMSDRTIKLFQSTRKYYQMLGVHPSTSPTNQKLQFNWRALLVFSIILLDFSITSLYFLFKTNIRIDYAETLQSFYFSSTEFNFLLGFVVNFWKMSNIFMLIEGLEKTIYESKFIQNEKQKGRGKSIKSFLSLGSLNPVSKAQYVHLSDRIERMSIFFHFILTKLTLMGVVIPSGIITINNYYIKDLGEESFFLPVSVMYVWENGIIQISIIGISMYIFYYNRLPFNWKTPLGYTTAYLFGCISVYTIICSILPTICLTVGSYWLNKAIIKDIIMDYRILNDKASDINQKEMLELFCKVIEDMSDSKQLSDRF